MHRLTNPFVFASLADKYQLHGLCFSLVMCHEEYSFIMIACGAVTCSTLLQRSIVNKLVGVDAKFCFAFLFQIVLTD